MKTAGGTTDVGVAGAPSAPGGRIARWLLAAVLALVGSLGLGHVGISLAWLLVDPTASWRDRSTGHALGVGGVLLVLLMVTLKATARSSVLVRAAAAMVVGSVFVFGLANVPHTLGGMKPSCVVVHVVPSEFSSEFLHDVGLDAGPASIELLYSDSGWHHFRLADGRNLEMRRELVAAVQSCQGQ